MSAKGQIPVPPEWVTLVMQALHDKQWTQEMLSRKADVSTAAISRLKNGGGSSWATIVSVAKALDIEQPVLVAPHSAAGRLARLPADKAEAVLRFLDSLGGHNGDPPAHRPVSGR